jgi:hypothetical protein
MKGVWHARSVEPSARSDTRGLYDPLAVLRLAEGAICGTAAGVVTGIAARIAMRMVADGFPDTMSRLPTFTLGGTVGIVVLTTLIGAPLGVIYAMTRDALRGPPVVQGASFGVLLLGVFGPLFFYGNPLEFGIVSTHLTTVSLFGSLFLIFGATAGIALAPAQHLARSLPEPGRAFLALVGLGGGAVLALGTVGFGAEVIKTYGGTGLRLVLPWFALAVVLAIALRHRKAPAGFSS